LAIASVSDLFHSIYTLSFSFWGLLFAPVSFPESRIEPAEKTVYRWKTLELHCPLGVFFITNNIRVISALLTPTIFSTVTGENVCVTAHFAGL
jgi:hypothetical protein